MKTMPRQKYLCIQRSVGGQCETPSPAQMEEMYAKFNAWREKYQKNLIDLGGKLAGGAVMSSQSETDGPFVESKEIVGGYMIIETDSLEEAKQVVRESPGVMMPGASVELREISQP